MKQFLASLSLVLTALLFHGTAIAEHRYFIEGLEITVPDNWLDIDSKIDFLKDKNKINAYTRPSPEGSLPLIRIIEVAAPGNDRGMLTFSIKPCYRGECPTREQLHSLSRGASAPQKNSISRRLITDDGSKLLVDYGVSANPACGGYFVTRGQKVEAPFGGVFISKSKAFYRNGYVISASSGYAENASGEVIERIEAALDSFRCTGETR